MRRDFESREGERGVRFVKLLSLFNFVEKLLKLCFCAFDVCVCVKDRMCVRKRKNYYVDICLLFVSQTNICFQGSFSNNSKFLLKWCVSVC